MIMHLVESLIVAWLSPHTIPSEVRHWGKQILFDGGAAWPSV